MAHGYDAASIARIAQRAGISKGNVYVHFASKEAIFETLLLQLLGRAGTDWDEMFGGAATAEEFVDGFIDHAYAGLTPESVAVMRLLITDIHRVPALAHRWNESLRADRDARQRVLDSLVARGVLRRGPMTDCFYLAAAPIVFISVMQMVMPLDEPLIDPELIKRTHRSLMIANLAP